jgi:FMN reductase
MAHILSISGSPSVTSRTGAVLRIVENRLAASGHTTETLAVRDVPPAALLGADLGHPAIAAAATAVERADGVIVATPVYKASYTGLLKALLDVLPQYALTGKTVLPLATGGSAAHVLAIDYALRPVLTSMGARHVVQGYFLLDTSLVAGDDGQVGVEPSAWAVLAGVIDGFHAALPERGPAVLAQAV